MVLSVQVEEIPFAQETPVSRRLLPRALEPERKQHLSKKIEWKAHTRVQWIWLHEPLASDEDV